MTELAFQLTCLKCSFVSDAATGLTSKDALPVDGDVCMRGRCGIVGIIVELADRYFLTGPRSITEQMQIASTAMKFQIAVQDMESLGIEPQTFAELGEWIRERGRMQDP